MRNLDKGVIVLDETYHWIQRWETSLFEFER